MAVLATTLAAQQHSTRQQLVAAGIPEGRIRRRVRDGWLGRVGRGVYRIGPVAGPLDREWAAVLAAPESAVLADWNAAGVLRLAASPATGSVALLVAGSASGRCPGVKRCRDFVQARLRRIRRHRRRPGDGVVHHH